MLLLDDATPSSLTIHGIASCKTVELELEPVGLARPDSNRSFASHNHKPAERMDTDATGIPAESGELLAYDLSRIHGNYW